MESLALQTLLLFTPPPRALYPSRQGFVQAISKPRMPQSVAIEVERNGQNKDCQLQGHHYDVWLKEASCLDPGDRLVEERNPTMFLKTLIETRH